MMWFYRIRARLKHATYKLRCHLAVFLCPEIWQRNAELQRWSAVDRSHINELTRELMRIRLLTEARHGETELDAVKRLKKDLDLQAEHASRSIVIAPESDEYQPVRDFLLSRNFGVLPISGSLYKKGTGVTYAYMKDGVIISDESDS